MQILLCVYKLFQLFETGGELCVLNRNEIAGFGIALRGGEQSLNVGGNSRAVVIDAAGRVVIGYGKSHDGAVGVGVGILHYSFSEGVGSHYGDVDNTFVGVISQGCGEYLSRGCGVLIAKHDHRNIYRVIERRRIFSVFRGGDAVSLGNKLGNKPALVLIGDDGLSRGNNVRDNVANAMQESAGIAAKIEDKALCSEGLKGIDRRLELIKGVAFEGNYLYVSSPRRRCRQRSFPQPRRG